MRKFKPAFREYANTTKVPNSTNFGGIPVTRSQTCFSEPGYVSQHSDHTLGWHLRKWGSIRGRGETNPFTSVHTGYGAHPASIQWLPHWQPWSRMNERTPPLPHTPSLHVLKQLYLNKLTRLLQTNNYKPVYRGTVATLRAGRFGVRLPSEARHFPPKRRDGLWDAPSLLFNGYRGSLRRGGGKRVEGRL